MVNAWLLLPGVGMMLIGIIPAIWWWRTKKVPVKYFAFGAILWIIAIAPKVLMDLTITPSLRDYTLAYGTEVFVIVTGIYVGLRTGLFESGFTYIAGLKTKLKNVNFNQAMAFGLGFGGFEAFILGFLSFISIAIFLAIPSLLEQLSAEQLQQLNQSTWIIFAPIMERGFTILIHIFAALLVFYAIRTAQKRYLWYSIGYKTIVDGIIPALTTYIGSQTLTGVYTMELPFIGLGVIAAGGILWIKRIWRDKNHA